MAYSEWRFRQCIRGQRVAFSVEGTRQRLRDSVQRFKKLLGDKTGVSVQRLGNRQQGEALNTNI